MNQNRKWNRTGRRNWTKRAAAAAAAGMTAAAAVAQSAAPGALVVYAEESAENQTGITKEETVYVSADASGKTEKVTVSDWLKNAGSISSVKDESSLQEIRNVKGNEKFSRNGDSLVWETEGADIYYQGETEEELPVEVNLTWYLDGKEVKPEELEGRSGHLEVRFDYTNRAARTVENEGKEQKVFSPFLMVTGLILPGENCTNVKIDNGRVISDGNRNFVVGIAMPGLQESLGLSDFAVDSARLAIPESLTVSADVTDFEVPDTYTAAVSDLFSDLNPEEITDISSLQNALDALEDAALELADGGSELFAGAKSFAEGVDSYTAGADQLSSAVCQYLGTDGELSGQVTEYVDGVNTLVLGIEDYTAGAEALSDGVASYVAGEEQLAEGASRLNALSSGLVQVQGALDQLYEAVDGEPDAGGGADIKVAAQALAKGTQDMENALGSDAVASLLSQIGDMTQTGKTLAAEAADMGQGLEQGIARPVQEIAGTLEGISGELEKITDAQASLLASCSELNHAVNADNEKIAAAKSTAAESGAKIRYSIDTLTARKSEVEAADPDMAAELQKSIDALAEAQNAVSGLEGMEALEGISEEQAGSGIDVDALNQAAGTIRENLASFAASAAELQEQIPELEAKLEGLQNSVEGLPADSLETLSGQVEALNSGMGQLNAAIGGQGGLSESVAVLRQSADDSFPMAIQGLEELNTGFDRLGSFNDTLLAGAARLKDSSPAVSEGASVLAEGTGRLSGGLGMLGGQLSEGASVLMGNSEALRAGAAELQAGTQTLANGLDQFEQEGTGKLKYTLEEEFGDIVERLEALTSDDAKYDTFSGKAEGMDGNVKFIIETGI